MSPSTITADATAVQVKPQGPSCPGDTTLQRVPVPAKAARRPSRDAHGAAALNAPGRKWGRPRPKSLMQSDLEQLMEEPAGGANHGRKRDVHPESGAAVTPLASTEWQAAEFMRSTGWTVARAKDPSAAGMTGHRGALSADEYVDKAVLEGLVEDELGFTLEHLHSVYSTGGRIPSTRRELRDRIDARLLALSRSGANMDLFGRVTGLNPSTLDRALARAQVKEGK